MLHLRDQIADRIAITAGFVAGGAAVGGDVIDKVNSYLQAGTYLVGMISGILSAVYIIYKIRHRK